MSDPQCGNCYKPKSEHYHQGRDVFCHKGIGGGRDVFEIRTDRTDLPACPHCGGHDQDWWDGQPNRNDGDEWEVDCGFCDESYAISMSVSVSFTTREKL